MAAVGVGPPPPPRRPAARGGGGAVSSMGVAVGEPPAGGAAAEGGGEDRKGRFAWWCWNWRRWRGPPRGAPARTSEGSGKGNAESPTLQTWEEEDGGVELVDARNWADMGLVTGL